MLAQLWKLKGEQGVQPEGKVMWAPRLVCVSAMMQIRQMWGSLNTSTPPGPIVCQWSLLWAVWQLVLSHLTAKWRSLPLVESLVKQRPHMHWGQEWLAKPQFAWVFWTICGHRAVKERISCKSHGKVHLHFAKAYVGQILSGTFSCLGNCLGTRRSKVDLLHEEAWRQPFMDKKVSEKLRLAKGASQTDNLWLANLLQSSQLLRARKVVCANLSLKSPSSKPF